MSGLPYFDVVLHSKDAQITNCLETTIRQHIPSLLSISTKHWNEGIKLVAQLPLSHDAISLIVSWIEDKNNLKTFNWVDLENVLDELKPFGGDDIHTLKEAILCHFVADIPASDSIAIWLLTKRFNSKYEYKARKVVLSLLVKDVLAGTVDLEFYRMSRDDLACLLSDDELKLTTEKDVAEIAQRWIDAMPEERFQYVPSLLMCARSETIEATNFARGNRQPLSRTVKWRVICLGGYHDRTTDQIEMYNPVSESWSVLNMRLPRSLAYHGAVVLNGCVYVFGGGEDTGMNYRKTYCLTRTMRWVEKCEMNHSRCYIANSCCELDGYIYVMGGRSENGARGTRLNSVERYDPVANKWYFLSSMHMGRSDAAAAAINGKIYVVGGFNGAAVTANVEMYDPTMDMWMPFEDLPLPRTGMCLLFNGTTLLSIGGFDGATRTKTVYTLDMTNPSARWGIGPSLNYARSHFSASLVGNNMVVAGGFYTRVLDSAEILEDGSWRPLATLNTARSAMKVLTIDDVMAEGMRAATSDMADHYDNFVDLPLVNQN